MNDMFRIPLMVYGIGFAISMGIAVMIKLLLNAIRFFSKRNIEESN